MSGIDKKDAIASSKNNTKTKKGSINKSINKKSKSHQIASYNSIATSAVTQYFKQEPISKSYQRITVDEFEGNEESISRSSTTYRCKYGPEGKVYTEKGLLKRNLMKELDPRPLMEEWKGPCSPLSDEELMEMMMFLVNDPPEPVERFEERWCQTLDAFCIYTQCGYKVKELDNICCILDYLVENKTQQPYLMKYLERLCENMNKPIVLTDQSDIINYLETVQSYFTFVDYLLATTVEDCLFFRIASGLQLQFSASDSFRGKGKLPLATAIVVATSSYQTVSRMLGCCADNRFCSFLNLANVLAINSVDNCLNMMMENILESIFYRFNPYFPNKKLEGVEISPYKVDSSTEYKVGKWDFCTKCLVWAYRYECRMPDHRHQRNTMTAIIMGLTNIFGSKLDTFGYNIMLDVLSMAVMSEVKPRNEWLAAVPFNKSQLDFEFKNRLIGLSLMFLKAFPTNVVLIETYHWMLGLMYLLDPGLTSLRVKWTAPLFTSIRKSALQALIVAIPLSRTNLVEKYGLIRRILWYIEWYPESPYELTTLYWCVRLLKVSLYSRTRADRATSVQQLLDTHGVIILINLCNTLLIQQQPPVEKSQAIICVILRILTTAAQLRQDVVACVVYPGTPWPISLAQLAENMIDIVVYSLNRNICIGERWLVSLLNFTWEIIIWNDKYRKIFLNHNGLYKLLDMIPKISASCQCIALALICDITVTGDAVHQLVTWRANCNVAFAQTPLVKPGATIAALLAAIFRDECQQKGIALTEEGILTNVDLPLATEDYEILGSLPMEYQNMSTVICYSAASMSGSRLSKIFAILHLLSRDLTYKVSLLDETYKTYKNVKLSSEDEIALIAVSHYLTLKLNEAWQEMRMTKPTFTTEDKETVEEFIEIGNGWTAEIIRAQNCVLETRKKKDIAEENSLYEFLGRIRLNIALDAVHMVRRCARSSDRNKLLLDMFNDALLAHQRLDTVKLNMKEDIIRTYYTPLDDQDTTRHQVRIPVLKTEKPKSRKQITSCFNVSTDLNK